MAIIRGALSLLVVVGLLLVTLPFYWKDDDAVPLALFFGTPLLTLSALALDLMPDG